MAILVWCAASLAACDIYEPEDVFDEHMGSRLGAYLEEPHSYTAGGLTEPAVLYGGVRLTADVPSDAVDFALAELAGYRDPRDWTFEPLGVIARGVPLCSDSDSYNDMKGLQEWLTVEDRELAGTWACEWDLSGQRISDVNPVFTGDLAQFLTDTEFVKEYSGIGGSVELTDVFMTASSSTGRVPVSVQGEWTEVNPRVSDVIDAVAEDISMREVSVVDSALTITVDATRLVDTVQESADRAAAGELEVNVETTDDGEVGAFADELREIDGVTRVAYVNSVITVSVERPDLIGVVHDAVRSPAVPNGLTETRMWVRGASASSTSAANVQYRMTLPYGGAQARATEELAANRALASAEVTDTGWSSPRYRLVFHGVLSSVLLDSLKELLPAGAELEITTTADEDRSYSLAVRQGITVDDVQSDFPDDEVEQFVNAWN